MSRLTSVAPVLLVKDIVASANYWRDKLGFSYDRFWGEPANFCMVRRDNLTIMLSKAPANHEILPHWKVVGQMWNAYFWVDNVDAIYDEFVKSGAIIDYGLSVRNYGVKEFGIRDLDDHDIAFGQLL